MRLGSTLRHRPDRPLWLVTFADLVALLLAFFVMMFATQRVERLPWEALINSLSRSLNPEQSVQKSERSSRRNIRRLSAERVVDLGYLEKLLRDQAAVEVSLGDIRIRRGDDRLTLINVDQIVTVVSRDNEPSPDPRET